MQMQVKNIVALWNIQITSNDIIQARQNGAEEVNGVKESRKKNAGELILSSLGSIDFLYEIDLICLGCHKKKIP